LPAGEAGTRLASFSEGGDGPKRREPGSVLQIEPGSFFRTRFASFSEGGDGPNGVNLVQTPNQIQEHRGA
jgi:hypothetical protein